MSFYRRPSKFARFLNRALTPLITLGLAPRDTVLLEIKGRRSGKLRSQPVTLVERDGRQYVVSPRGETEWVRNLRAAQGEAIIRRRRRERVRLLELPPEQRASVLKAYLRKTAIATRRHFALPPDAALEEFEKIASRHPVFRIEQP